MTGPRQRGFWTAALGPGGARDFQTLRVGRRYTVIRPFRDYDGDDHPAGEAWTFLGHSFVPYDDGLSLYVSTDGGDEWLIRLQWRADEQAPVINALAAYLAPGP